MRVQLAGVARHHGAKTILEGVTLTVGPRSRLGLVGPNGVGKTTLLRLIAGLERPDAGAVTHEPDTLAVGYVPQEAKSRSDESVLAALRRRTGVATAERELEDAASALASGARDAADRYDRALGRFLALGGGDLEPRASAVCGDLGLAVPLDQTASTLSGGEAARASLAAILLSRFDVLCLDEPTNDLDFDGLDRLERFVDRFDGGLVVVSHDRAFLDRVATRIVAIDPWTPWRPGVRGRLERVRLRRDEAQRAAREAFELAQGRRRELTELLARRRTEARATGAGLGNSTGGSDRRATHALTTKVRQAERMLERTESPDKPFDPWRLQLTLAASDRPGDLVAALDGAVADRGAFRLGPIDVDLVPGERLAVIGRNGSGKSTLLGMLLGDVPLAPARGLSAGARRSGRSARAGSGSPVTRRCSTRVREWRWAPAGRSTYPAREVRSRRRPRRAIVRDAHARRADTRRPRRAPGPRRQPARARRADQPPRPGGGRAAGSRARRLRRARSWSSRTTGASSRRWSQLAS